ncbi:MAG: DNA cytosine methyltransferase [Deltaproteobacteria bacterium]|nr:DNA cytosine methyltransferase [Myxococcales bacterium]MDP3220575.1 DNA cytosine methyltransferase [Deltaproteobacteria bacterium]
MGFDYVGGALDEIDVDNFAGGGGASTGIERATGRPITIAVNHSRAAIAMHAANHPHTHHECEDIWAVDPRTVCAGRRVRRAWFSPDCTHFSKAKGGQPRSKEVRGLAGVVVKWAREVQPEDIYLENVEEFADWGPLDENGRPDRALRGADFRAWLAALVDCGYDVEHRVLVAANYGTPTTRKRLFLKAVRKGRPIVWPEATHGKGRTEPWNTAASIIDWSLPCPSIFDRKRPLAEATLRRIAAGLRRYVIDAPTPFIVPLTHQGGDRTHSLSDPFRTITAANRGELALVTPYLATVTHTQGGDRVASASEPLRTVTTAKGGEFVLVAPTMVQTGYGEREGQRPRALDIGAPLGTVVSGGKHALVSAFLAKHYGGPNGHQTPGQSMDAPTGAVTTQDHHAIVQMELAFLSKFYGTSTGAELADPLPTVTTGGGRGGGHLAEVRAFLVKYYGADGGPGASQQSLFDPLHTVTTKARFGLVMVHGEPYQITDIGMRMLAPRELFNAQGFPADYDIDPPVDGKLLTKRLTKTQQIELAGNSVCGQVAEALVSAGRAGGRAAA